jgi:hypothetical protein
MPLFFDRKAPLAVQRPSSRGAKPNNLPAMGNRLPVGVGSRGGHWHEARFRHEYQRAWRLAHPEYREREKLRTARRRGGPLFDPAGTEVNSDRPAPSPAVLCACGCKCREAVVTVCGWCRSGQHPEPGD